MLLLYCAPPYPWMGGLHDVQPTQATVTPCTEDQGMVMNLVHNHSSVHKDTIRRRRPEVAWVGSIGGALHL